jgi:hypothetical protein
VGFVRRSGCADRRAHSLLHGGRPAWDRVSVQRGAARGGLRHAREAGHRRGPAASGGAPRRAQEAGEEPRDPLEALLAGDVDAVEFSGGRVLVDAPRSGRVYLPGSFNPLHDGHRRAARGVPHFVDSRCNFVMCESAMVG